MSDTTLTVRCVCGWEATGEEAIVVADTIDHGRRMHNMEATREQVLAMAIAAPAEPDAHLAEA
jgi:predicted small metal-binding protein